MHPLFRYHVAEPLMLATSPSFYIKLPLSLWAICSPKANEQGVATLR